MTEARRGSAVSAAVCNASMLLYTVWLMIPAVQTTGRSYMGAAAVGVFAVGLAMDGAARREWKDWLPRVLLCALLPVVCRVFMQRGGANGAGFLVQQGMFWFPLLWCAYARRRGERVWRYAGAALLVAMAVTTCTTIGWLVQGIVRGGGETVYAYSRSLGFGEPGNEAYLKELMQRNIGGYDFVYATALTLPLTCWAVIASKGWKRAGFAALCAAQAVMIVLSQYTTAMLIAALVLAVELIAAVIRAIWKKTGVGASLLWALVPLIAAYLARVPLTEGLAALCERAGFENMAQSARQLLTLLAGGEGELGRVATYQQALDGFARSPWVGAMFSRQFSVSQHSDLLDLLSGVGLIGGAAALGGVWVIGRGSLAGIRKSAAAPHVAMTLCALAALCCVGTVVYSRDIALAVTLGGALLARRTE